MLTTGEYRTSLRVTIFLPLRQTVVLVQRRRWKCRLSVSAVIPIAMRGEERRIREGRGGGIREPKGSWGTRGLLGDIWEASTISSRLQLSHPLCYFLPLALMYPCLVIKWDKEEYRVMSFYSISNVD